MLENITFDYEVAEEQKDLFTPCHVLYVCTIEYNGDRFTAKYQCNSSKKPTKEDFIVSLVNDIVAIETAEDIDSFFEFFCYRKVSKCIEDFNACKVAKHKLETMFTSDEFTLLIEELQPWF